MDTISRRSDPDADFKPSVTMLDIEKGTDAANTISEVAPERLIREKALLWKQDLRIVPLSATIYLLCYLDRSNIGTNSTVPRCLD